MADTPAEAGHCREPGCDAATTGRCQDQHPLRECPSFVPIEELNLDDGAHGATAARVFAIDGSSTARPTSITREDWVQLPRGAALLLAEATSIRARSIPRLVLLAGGAKAGKTTLLTSTYEAFLRGQFESLVYCESATLPGFEERCFLNRPESGGLRPDTQRTPSVAEPRFLHLRLAPANAIAQHTDLLLGDVSGEDFEAIVNDASSVNRVPCLERVDHLVVVIDGEKLADAERWNEEWSVDQLIARLSAPGAVPRDSHCHLVVTKADLLLVRDNDGGDVAKAVLDTLGARASKHFSAVTRHVVAARPTQDVDPSRRDLSPLLMAWMASCRALPVGGE